MNFRLTIALSIILMLAALAFFLVKGKDTTTKSTSTGATKLLNPHPADITRIDFTRYGENVSFAKVGDQWKITAPISANADNGQLNTIANNLKDIAYLQKYAAESTGNHSPETTGTANPHYRIKFSDSAGHENTLNLGKRGAEGIYATLNGDKTIYLLENNPLTNLDKDFDAFRNLEIKTVDTSRITGLALQSRDQNWTLTKSGEKWLISAPISGRANSTSVDELVRQFQAIRAQSFSTLSKKDCGLDPPLVSVKAIVQDSAATMPASTGPATASSQPAGTPVVLQLGFPTDLTMDKKDSPVYASLAGTDEVFVLSNDAAKKLTRELKELRDPAVTPAPTSQATDLTISTDGATTVSVAKKDSAWKLLSAGTPDKPLVADPFAISDYLAIVRDLRAINYVDNAGDLKSIGLDPPHMKIEMSIPSQSQHEVILVGKPETAQKVTPVMRQGEPTVYLIQTTDAEKLIASNLNFRDKDIENLNADKICRIEIAGPAATPGIAAPSTQPATAPGAAPATMATTAPAPPPGITLEHAGMRWEVKKGDATLTPDESKLTALLSDFTPVTASKYLDEKPESSGTPSITVKVTILEPTLTAQPAARPATAPASMPATSPATGPAASAPATRPDLASILPPPPLMGPDPGKLVVYTLNMYKQEANGTTSWKAVWDHQEPAWTFQPTPNLIDHVTKEVYVTPTTQPATKPG